ncbi:MAG: 50S ribosomal protein L30 [Deltaproteobacteria bacterium]|nr:MAG: 50S ribosomal protein L30 [Deltaproteobacteria bacterium]
MAGEGEMIRVTLVGSHAGCTKRQRETLKGLGLTRRGRSVILRDSEPVRGMIRKVQHLVKVEA